VAFFFGELGFDLVFGFWWWFVSLRMELVPGDCCYLCDSADGTRVCVGIFLL